MCTPRRVHDRANRYEPPHITGFVTTPRWRPTRALALPYLCTSRITNDIQGDGTPRPVHIRTGPTNPRWRPSARSRARALPYCMPRPVQNFHNRSRTYCMEKNRYNKPPVAPDSSPGAVPFAHVQDNHFVFDFRNFDDFERHLTYTVVSFNPQATSSRLLYYPAPTRF